MLDRELAARLRASFQLHADRTAVAAEDGRLSFRELDDRSDVLAAALTARGLGPGQVCAILLGRSQSFITAVAAILKAGAAYLPLAADAPFERNRKILDDARVRVIISSSGELAATRAEGKYRTSWRIVDIDAPGDDAPLLAGPADGPVPHDTAYVLFTSGSTGEPKGTINSGRAVLNLVDALHTMIYRRYEGVLDVAVVAPFVFDPSVQQIFAALLLGHTLHIVPEEARLDGRIFLHFLRKHHVHITDGTPTHLRLLADTDATHGALPELRHLIIGGEPMTADGVRRFWHRFGSPRPAITNVYGVAECAVDATAHEVDPQRLSDRATVPIGIALPGVEVHLLDEQGTPVAVGEVGELWIGGAAVGNGYVGRPDLTAERFVDHPLTPGEKIYRTGDLARRLETGELDFVGRNDRQFKIAAHRIEPGEIEAAIRAFAGAGRPSAEPIADEPPYCTRCVLDARWPGVSIVDGVCSICRWFDANRAQLDAYFDDTGGFRRIMDESRAGRSREAPDCLLLYSGGKDSSYVLHRLLEDGYRVATFTFDNGFISDTALANIERVTTRYNVHHTTISLPQMNDVFRASLQIRSTVCDGCFRALTLASTRLAQERGINVVITGLSRGQIVETKLWPLFQNAIFEASEVHNRLRIYRDLYNSRADAIGQALGISLNDTTPDPIHYVDYFKFDSARRGEVLSYLKSVDERWRAPKDTGLCSTNCRANDVGIYVHQLERGFHNYAAPLSWDCRLGVISREEAAGEIAAPSAEVEVKHILVTLGYQPKSQSRGVIRDAVAVTRPGPSGHPVLCAYFVGEGPIDIPQLQAHLATRLPEYMLPRFLERIDALPTTHNGKIDVAKLPPPTFSLRDTAECETESERRLCALWREVLGVERIGRDDNFFDLGGESATAALIVQLIELEYGVVLSVTEAFRDPTIREMAVLLPAQASRADKRGAN